MSNLLIQEVPLMVLPTLATKIGLNEAMFLQQLHYWIDRSKHEMEGHRWIYNTIEDWCKQFPFWSRRTITRVISALERHRLVLTANYNRKGFDRTKWYTVNYELLARLEAEPVPMVSLLEDKEVDKQEETRPEEENPVGIPALIEEEGQPSAVNNPVSEAKHVGGTSMMPNWHNEENQGLAASCVGGTSMMPDWHPPLCQNDQMECVNLAQPIPENNYRDYSENTTTTSGNKPSMDQSAESGKANLLLLSAPAYGISENVLRKYLHEFGEGLVLKEFELLKKLLQQKKPIQNPSGWLRCALEEQYADTGADFEKIQQEQMAAAEAKNQARKEFYEQQLREEQEKDHTEVDKSSPFYGYYLRHCKRDEDTGISKADSGNLSGA